MSSSPSRTLRIVVPLFIVLAIVGIWFLKNPPQGEQAPQLERSTAELPEALRSADFGLKATEAVDFQALASYGLPVFTNYGADYCMPCQEMAPHVEAVNQKLFGKAFIKYVNISTHREALGGLPIQIVPSQVLVTAEGKPYLPSAKIAGQFDFTIHRDKDSGEHLYTIHQGGLDETQMLAIIEDMGVQQP